MDQTQNFDDEHHLFELLDAYVNSLKAGDAELSDPPAELLEAFPDLSELLDCIDTLDAMAGNTLLEADQASTPAKARMDPVRDFGRYELVREVGRGGMGVVFEARQPLLNSHVALKIVRSGQFASQQEIQRFHSEARAAAGLRHPNIVSVHDVGVCHGEHFLTMDLVRGVSLADALRDQGRFDPRCAAEILATVARAVHYLHDHKIVHRDLKPSNIMLDEEGTPFVTDFGLAKVFEADSQETTTGTIIGTASYMSPEQASGRSKEVSARSDVYSLGTILYEMLAGRPPFHEENPLDTLLLVMESEPDPLRKQVPGVPAELEAICMACLEKDPDQRLESAYRVAVELERYLRNEPIHIKGSSWSDRLHRWRRREPALVSRLAIVAAGAGVVQANYLLDPSLIPFPEHLRMMCVIGAWALTCIICQKLMLRESWENRMPYVWAVTDVIFLTTILILARPGRAIGPIVIGYPLLVVASGLWFEVRLVWLMTVLSCLGYLLVNVLRDEPVDAFAAPPQHYPYIFAVVLCGIGYIVAYQVERIRALNRYFERRPQ